MFTTQVGEHLFLQLQRVRGLPAAQLLLRCSAKQAMVSWHQMQGVIALGSSRG
jgi:hypothetical protein